jgi:hypothetical protein
MLLMPAGTRPEPAVSVPNASGTRPAATAVAEPELDPPGMSFSSKRLRGAPVGRTQPDQPGGELVEVGLADDDRPGLLEPGDRSCIRVSLIGKGRTGCRGGHSFHVDVVLHRNRNAVKRQIALGCRAQRSGFVCGILLVAKGDEYRRIGIRLDAHKAARDCLLGRCAAAAVGLKDFSNRLGHAQLHLGSLSPHERLRRGFEIRPYGSARRRRVPFCRIRLRNRSGKSKARAHDGSPGKRWPDSCGVLAVQHKPSGLAITGAQIRAARGFLN